MTSCRVYPVLPNFDTYQWGAVEVSDFIKDIMPSHEEFYGNYHENNNNNFTYQQQNLSNNNLLCPINEETILATWPTLCGVDNLKRTNKCTNPDLRLHQIYSGPPQTPTVIQKRRTPMQNIKYYDKNAANSRTKIHVIKAPDSERTKPRNWSATSLNKKLKIFTPKRPYVPDTHFRKSYQLPLSNFSNVYSSLQKYDNTHLKFGDTKHKYGDLKLKHGDLKFKYDALKARHGDSKIKHGDPKAKHGDLKPKNNDDKPKKPASFVKPKQLKRQALPLENVDQPKYAGKMKKRKAPIKNNKLVTETRSSVKTHVPAPHVHLIHIRKKDNQPVKKTKKFVAVDESDKQNKNKSKTLPKKAMDRKGADIKVISR